MGKSKMEKALKMLENLADLADDETDHSHFSKDDYYQPTEQDYENDDYQRCFSYEYHKRMMKL